MGGIDILEIRVETDWGISGDGQVVEGWHLQKMVFAVLASVPGHLDALVIGKLSHLLVLGAIWWWGFFLFLFLFVLSKELEFQQRL